MQDAVSVCRITVPGRDVQQGSILPSESHVVSLSLWLSLRQLRCSPTEFIYQKKFTDGPVSACSDSPLSHCVATLDLLFTL